jgi:hypothetical protein
MLSPFHLIRRSDQVTLNNNSAVKSLPVLNRACDIGGKNPSGGKIFSGGNE